MEQGTGENHISRLAMCDWLEHNTALELEKQLEAATKTQKLIADDARNLGKLAHWVGILVSSHDEEEAARVEQNCTPSRAVDGNALSSLTGRGWQPR